MSKKYETPVALLIDELSELEAENKKLRDGLQNLKEDIAINNGISGIRVIVTQTYIDFLLEENNEEIEG